MNPNKKIIVISLIIFISSLFFNAFKVIDLGKIENYKSILIFLFGSISFLGGGFLEFLIWSANIWFLASLLFIYRKDYFISFICSFIAFLISMSFGLWKEVLAAENGRKAMIYSLEAGYFLWIISFLFLTVSSIILKIKFRSEVCEL